MSAICEADPSIGPNRPHISSVTINFKERRDKTYRMRPNLVGAPRLQYLSFFRLPPRNRPFPSDPSGAHQRLSAAGEGGVYAVAGESASGFFIKNAIGAKKVR